MVIAVETHDLTRRFGALDAVAGLNLRIETGETIGIVGPDGAGKTTLLRMLAAVLRPTSGDARVFGLDTHRDSERIRGFIGYMPQRFSLYGDLSVLENLDFFASIFGVERRERAARFQQLLGFTSLAGFEDRRAANLSGGMQKKLALACTLIHRPRILLLDEPTTGVDPVSRREFWDILSGLRVSGITIVISTPYMDEADRCTRVGLVYAGRLVAFDSPDALARTVPGRLVVVRPVAADAQVEQQDENRLLREAVAALRGAPGILETQTHGEMLHILVDDTSARLPEIHRILGAAGLRAEGAHEARPHLEDAFISLVRGLQASGAERTP